MPSGALNASFDSAQIKEGLAATIKIETIPLVTSPERNIVAPRELIADFEGDMVLIPEAPTTPGGMGPAVDELPKPKKIKPEPVATGDCTTAADCPVNFTCIANYCEPQTFGCINDFDCFMGESCIGNQCIYSGCNQTTCPYTGTCGGCQSMDCCIQYGCLCY